MRARPVAGDLRFGARLLEALAPFVWRRAVDPRVVEEMTAMLARARAEAGDAMRDDDLKIGPGGIREVEFFAQSLQLVWGGREPRVRGTNTLDALRRLRARGFVSEREEAELSDAYLFLRRLEHRIQNATGLQTHALPARRRDCVARIARSLGYDDAPAGSSASSRPCARASRRGSRRSEESRASHDVSFERLAAALDARDEARRRRGGGRALRAVRRRAISRVTCSSSAGARTVRSARRRAIAMPAFARLLVDALAGAADPEQATRLLAAFFARLATPGVYVRALADDPRLVRALTSLLGASAFLGEALVGHPGSRRPRRLRARRAVTARSRAGRSTRRLRRSATTRATWTHSSGRCAAPSAASRSRWGSPISRATSGRGTSRTH